MKTASLLMLALLAAASPLFGQHPANPKIVPEKQPQQPKTITAEQVKAVWLKRLTPPRSLDPEYHQLMKAYKQYVVDIKAGKMDLDALDTAATYNRNRAMKDGDTAAASVYESELVRIAQAKASIERSKKEDSARLRFNTQMQELNSRLKRIEDAATVLANP